METLYCLSIKKHDEYQEHSVYTSFQNALITIYDIGLDRFSLLLETGGPEKAKKHVKDLKEINSIRTDYEPDKVTYLFDKKFRITIEEYENIEENMFSVTVVGRKNKKQLVPTRRV